MSTPPEGYARELAVTVTPCQTTVLEIQAVPAPGSEPPGNDTQPAGAGRIELTLVQQIQGPNGQAVEQPVTTIGTVVLRRDNPMPRTVPVAIKTEGSSAGTGQVDDVPAGTYALELLPVIYFDTGQEQVRGNDPKLQALIAILNGLGDRRTFELRIVGHADIQGGGATQANQDLSERRARSVKKALEASIDSGVLARLQILLEGKGAPPGKTDVDPRDRRVDFELARGRGS